MNAALVARALRRTLKVLHTVGAAGFMGGLAALGAALAIDLPSGGGAPLVAGLARIAAWVVGPCMILTVVSGLLAMLANPAFYDVGWVWLKALTGVLILEGGLHVLGPLQEEARRSAAALAGGADPAALSRLAAAELNTVWLLVAVSAANIVLGVWRPRFLRLAS